MVNKQNRKVLNVKRKVIVKEALNENIKIQGHEYSILPYHAGHIYVSN